METTTKRDKVQFLKHVDSEGEKDIYAFFPEIKWDSHYLTSYSHIGQHSAISIDYVRESILADYNEYEALKNELIQIGYNI